MIINQAALKKISNLEGQTCFGCGEKNPFGLHMQFLTDEQRVYSLVTVPTAMAGWGSNRSRRDHFHHFG